MCGECGGGRGVNLHSVKKGLVLGLNVLSNTDHLYIFVRKCVENLRKLLPMYRSVFNR